MNIEKIEKELDAVCIGSYTAGHTKSQILRFVRATDNAKLVVKFAPTDDSAACEDIAANLHGYEAIRSLGALSLEPKELRELTTLGDTGRALVMIDLGTSMCGVDGGIDVVKALWNNFMHVVEKTATAKQGGTQINKDALPEFVAEVLRHFERFSHSDVARLATRIRAADWTSSCSKKSALMLLDFTPDNLFVNKGILSFIDPWNQHTYLGNPAVSIGQFIELMKIYEMRHAEQAQDWLSAQCIAVLPKLLECDTSTIERALRLGATLQLVLSSYVRRESNQTRAAVLHTAAHNLWV